LYGGDDLIADDDDACLPPSGGRDAVV
jgi:hypothetical protein